MEYSEIGAKIKVKGGGNLLAYSSESPSKAKLNGAKVGFKWSTDGTLALSLPWNDVSDGVFDMAFLFKD